MVCILSDLEYVVQVLGLEVVDPAFLEVEVDLLVLAIYQDSVPQVV